MESICRLIPAMKQVHVANRAAWRRWLVRNHACAPEGIWLVFDKKGCGRPVLGYEEAVEEALCFGWIDGTIRSLDAGRYCRRFTPRRASSRWSPANRVRAERLIREGLMTALGLARINLAKRSGTWDDDQRPVISFAMPPDLVRALAGSRKARAFSRRLRPRTSGSASDGSPRPGRRRPGRGASPSRRFGSLQAKSSGSSNRVGLARRAVLSAEAPAEAEARRAKASQVPFCERSAGCRF